MRSAQKKRMLCLITVTLLLLSLFSCATGPWVEPVELGNPQAKRYEVGRVAACPWDIVLWQGKLYVGGGDYGPNDGPVDVWCYDTEAGDWSLSATLPDEEIGRFITVEDTLLAPGTDPRGEWDLGNYYVLESGEWKTVRRLPGGVHNFDIAAHDGMLFFGLGVVPGGMPVACSMDGGRTFSDVPMYKNGELLDTSGYKTVRVYDFFQQGDCLYAALICTKTEEMALTFELYRYEQGSLVYDNTWYGKLRQKRIVNNIVTAKAQLGDKLFFTTGYLYVTENMSDFVRVAFPGDATVYDLCVVDGVLYALCGREESDGKYTVSVWKNHRGGNTQFTRALCFTYDAPPLSLATDGQSFYIGMGDGKQPNDKNGMVLMIDLMGKNR